MSDEYEKKALELAKYFPVAQENGCAAIAQALREAEAEGMERASIIAFFKSFEQTAHTVISERCRAAWADGMKDTLFREAKKLRGEE